jgi:DNA-binding winged helix-turn-helix (wHTH) protein
MKLSLGDCVLDLAARQLWRAGAVVPLEPKMFELLQLLIQRRPAVVKNEELDELLWPNVYVARSSLTRLVSELRAVLGDTPRDSKIIRTVYKTGYAFSTPVLVPDVPPITPVIFSLLWNEHSWPLAEGDHTLGRGDECQVIIDAVTVSRVHARIRICGGAASIEDLGSTNGTGVNGVQISVPTPLGQSAEITLGTTKMVIRRRDQAMETVKVSEGDRDRLVQPFR